MKPLDQVRQMLGNIYTDQKTLTPEQAKDVAAARWMTPIRRCSFLGTPTAHLILPTNADAPGLTSACGGTVRNVPVREYDATADDMCNCCHSTQDGDFPPIHACPAGRSRYWHPSACADCGC